jgi:hypothetical protein
VNGFERRGPRAKGGALKTALGALLSALCISCAPSSNQPTTPRATGPVVSLTVNPLGDAVCIAADSSSAALLTRASIRSSGKVEWLQAPARVSSAAFVDGWWWLAVPRAGLAIKAQGVPQNVAISAQPTRLSSRAVFTLEGDVYSYAGARLGRVPGLPSSVIDTQDATFALVGKEVYAVGNGSVARVDVLESADFSLVAGGSGYVAVKGIAVRNNGLTYTLEGSSVSVSDGGGRGVKTISLSGKGSIIVVGGDTLAVAVGSNAAFYDARGLELLRQMPCGGAR